MPTLDAPAPTPDLPTLDLPWFAPLERAADHLAFRFAQLPGYAPVALPADLARAEGAYGGKPLSLRASAFTARGVRWGRVALIDGPGTWIMNAVVLPDDGFATPVLGIELLAFRGKMHLIVADLFPLVPGDEAVMDDIGPLFDHVGPPPETPPWASAIFSRRPVFRRPRSEEALADGGRASTLVADRWLALCRSAERASPAAAQIAARARDRYVEAHADDEPADPFLGKAFGRELGRRLVDEVLFPVASGSSRSRHPSTAIEGAA